MTADGSGGPSRRDPYRVVGYDPDPDLPLPDALDGSHAKLLTPTRKALDAAQWHVTGQTVERKPAAGEAACVLTIHCVPAGCGPDKGTGARLAAVYRTPEGLLYLARIVIAWKDVPTFEQLHDDAMVMYHPELEAERGTAYSSAHWVTRRGFQHQQTKGWRQVPDGVRPVDEWRKPRRTLVRDLLDRDDLEHPPLRAQCHRHGETVLDRGRVFAEARLARKRRRAVTLAGLGARYAESESM